MLKVTRTGPNVGLTMQKKHKAMTAALGRIILKMATIAGGFIAKEVVAKFKGGTGNLAGSFLPATFVQSSSGVAAGALSSLPHAKIQDQGSGYLPGGVIKAKPPLKNIAIPVTPIAKAIWPRDWADDAFDWRPSKKGGSVLIEKATDTLQYILKPEVKITGKKYLAAANTRFKADLPTKVAADIALEIKTVTGE